MPGYLDLWDWKLNTECEAESSNGDPYILRRNWGDFRPVQLQITVVNASGCDWSTIDVREMQGPGSATLLASPMPRILRGQESRCKQHVKHAQCTGINIQAESGLYVFEAVVGTVSGEIRRSELRLELRP